MRRLPPIAVLAAGILLLLAPTAQALVGEEFTYSGGEQTFTVPAGVHLVRLGAAGGFGGATADAEGGAGLVLTGFALVDPGQTLYVEVGGNGQSQAAGGAGGFNGGGAASGGGGGGGASDVRTAPLADGLSTDTRLIVAGGGGGAGGTGPESVGGKGGAAGEPGEEAPASGNEGGTPGLSNEGGGGGGGCGGFGEVGALGVGGAGAVGLEGVNGGGGGGGGLYGGGGGGGGCAFGGGGGGGGSSFSEGGLVIVTSEEPNVRISYLKPPTISIASPTADATIIQGQSLTASYECTSPEDVPIEECTGSVADGAALNTSNLGLHTLTVKAEDAAKGTASASAAYTVVAAPPPAPKSSAAAPETTISGHPKKTVKTKKKKAKVKFSFSSDVAGATFQCKLDKGSFAPCASPKTYKVKKGKHTFSVEAVGPGGTDATPATFSFKVKKKK
jgi:hypothetical protein